MALGSLRSLGIPLLQIIPNIVVIFELKKLVAVWIPEVMLRDKITIVYEIIFCSIISGDKCVLLLNAFVHAAK